MDKIQEIFQNLSLQKETKFSLPLVQDIYLSKQPFEKLDKIGYLENFLLKGLNNNLNNSYLMAILELINFKQRETIFIWDYTQNKQKFQQIFEYLISSNLSKFSEDENKQIVEFLITHFQKLEYEFINENMLKLVGPTLLLQVSQSYLKSYLLSYPHFISIVEKLIKNKKKLLTDQTRFISQLQDMAINSQNEELVNMILSLFIDLLSTIQTRKYLKPFLKGNFVIPMLKRKQMNIKNISLLQKMINYDINDETGEPLSKNHILLIQSDYYKKIQIFLFKNFDEQFSLKQIKNLTFINHFEDKTQGLLQVFEHMGLPIPENQELDFLIEIFQDFVPNDIDQQMEEVPLIPTEEEILTQEIPSMLKLNLQFLSTKDYLYRNFRLLKLESCYEIRQDILDSVEKITPVYSNKGDFSHFDSWARMGIPLQQLQIHEVKPPGIGQKVPERVFAEINYSISGLPNYLRKEWESLRKYDVVFLVSFANNKIQYIRGCEIVGHLDDQRNEITKEQRGNTRILQVEFDEAQYALDFEASLSERIYGSFKMIVRRQAKQNNFKASLFAIRDMIINQVQIQDELKDSLLGYGEYIQKIDPQNFEKIQLFDTFVSQQHFYACFKKNENIPQELSLSIKYQKIEQEKPNQIEFTKMQTKAIISSIQPGITLIKGPPGTGKTDVIVQAISLLYRNFPNQKILVITHSNQALTDIFEKIRLIIKFRNVDSIEERHLLRLGMGGSKIIGKDNDFSFGRMGRINYLLQRRIDQLELAKQLAQYLIYFSCIDYMEDAFTCETAEIFYNFHIRPRITVFRRDGTFAFDSYLPDLSDREQKVQEIENLFKNLRELRFLELIRNNKERGDSYMCNYARIVAMTSTHAALKRSRFLKIGFHYDSLVSEEQGQILEISTFISMNLQKENKLKRIILVGDDQQLPPIIKNNQLKMIGNLEQSLFKRFIRLGFNLIELQEQGRARHSIAQLYQWRYPGLTNLQSVSKNQEFNQPNPGFQHEFQFIDVQGRFIFYFRESQPNPFFYQNLDEAEFVVATYMYMRLMGIPAEKITILTTYNGQKFLIRDIVNQKCSWNNFFSRPHKIQTVDKYQGQQNDFVLLSLVRSQHVGHLRDPRRLVVAMSRARLGLYVFGNINLFDGYPEIQQWYINYISFDLFKQKPLKLALQQEQIQKNKKSGEAQMIQNSGELYNIVKQKLEQQLAKI